MEPSHIAFFATPVELRSWFEQHQGNTAELWVGFYKKGTGKPSITWPESVDQALCYGWIDGIRKSMGDEKRLDELIEDSEHGQRLKRSTWQSKLK